MGQAKENLMKIVEKMNENPKAQAVFVTNIVKTNPSLWK